MRADSSERSPREATAPMNVHRPRMFPPLVILTAGLFLVGDLCRTSVRAGEAQLKNGTIVTGNMWVMSTLSGPRIGRSQLLAPKDAVPVPHTILVVDNGWQITHVPMAQVAGNQFDDNVVLKPQAFTVKHQKSNQGLMVASIGSVKDVTPFDEFGRRRLSIETQKGPLQVIQGITQIEPDHVVVEGLNCQWKTGISLKAIPFSTINSLLRKQVKTDDPAGRLGLVGFFRQAGYFEEAFRELNEVARDFPDQQARCEAVNAELIDQWGREILRELARRRASGQHQRAAESAKTLSKQPLGGAILQDVNTFVAEYEQSRQAIERAKHLLVDWQAKLRDTPLVERLQPLRSEINEQLDFETLPRLDAFLKAEGDAQLTTEQHLALAYSGWVVGAANAVTDLDQAIRYWDARFAMLEYVREENPQTRDEHLLQLRRVEGVGPKIVMQLTSQLPPALDASGIVPAEPHRVLATPEGHLPELAYSVMLPPEYSPHHSYPLLIVLRSRGRTNDDLLRWWGGQADAPGPAMKRGYIVIAPEYTDEKQADYTYGVTAHQIVIDSLRDARRRFSVDSDRVFLAGHGMGADAAFDLGMSHPDEFAGVIPIGGDCNLYPKATYENGRFTSWYVVGRGFGNETPDRNNYPVYDEIFKRGARFDFMFVSYLGRGLDGYVEEIPKVFDWMDLHRRAAPPQNVQVESLRKTDNRFFWVTAVDLPRTTVLPQPPGTGNRINKMNIDARVSVGNIVTFESATEKFVVRFLPNLIDFDKRVIVRTKGRQKFNGFITPDSQAILEELRSTGDRSRLPLATQQF